MNLSTKTGKRGETNLLLPSCKQDLDAGWKKSLCCVGHCYCNRLSTLNLFSMISAVSVQCFVSDSNNKVIGLVLNKKKKQQLKGEQQIFL